MAELDTTHRNLTPDPVRPRTFRVPVAWLLRLSHKELREILRDRRTILTLLLMPLLLYPLVGIAFRQFFLSNLTSAAAPHYEIAVTSEPERRLVDILLRAGIGALKKQAAESRPAQKGSPFTYVHVRDLDLAVRIGQGDVGIRVRDAGQVFQQVDGDLASDWEVIYREDSVRSKEALAFVENCCIAANALFLEARLKQLKVNQRAVPIQVARRALWDPEAKTSVSLAALIPLVLILMTITGAVYPAIDLTAGERERGTLEVLVAAPIPRTGLLFAKYVAVVTVALLTALVNLTAMTLTLHLTGLATQVLGPGGLSFSTVAAVFGLLLLFAAFFSAVLLILTSFARSFKEAQAYLIPLMLVSLVPGMLGLSGIALGPELAVVPLINIVLLARDLFEGSAHPGLAALVVGSTLLYALGAITVAGRIFGAEAVLYGEGGGWRSFFRRRRP